MLDVFLGWLVAVWVGEALIFKFGHKAKELVLIYFIFICTMAVMELV